MFRGFYPDDYIGAVRDIDYIKLYEEGYRGLIFDIDNTLVKNNAPADAPARAFIARLRAGGFRIFLLSNNKEPRVRKFAEAVHADGYIYKAGKPSRKGYLKAIERMGTKTVNTLFVGDQLFTDIWGAKRTGIRTVMVLPVQKWNEEITIMAKRIVEDFVMLFYGCYVRKGGETRPIPMLMSGRRVCD